MLREFDKGSFSRTILGLYFIFFLTPPFSQIETIGDAYVVAGGLQSNCGTVDDAVKVALMALRMIDVAQSVPSPEGLPLKVLFPARAFISIF